jgi:hypothetical protein
MKHLAAVLVLLSAATAWAQPGSPENGNVRTVRIEFDNPGLVPARWQIDLHPDGTGHFRSQRGTAARDNSIEAPDQDLDFLVSPSYAAHVFGIATAEHLFAKRCASRQKVAFQGTKILSYTGPDGQGSCTFNYSEDKGIESLSDSLQGLATTLLEGARMEQLRLHDRLGLDAEIQSYSEMLGDGRAAEPEAIRDELERLADDESLLERVRQRAREILSKSGDMQG